MFSSQKVLRKEKRVKKNNFPIFSFIMKNKKES